MSHFAPSIATVNAAYFAPADAVAGAGAPSGVSASATGGNTATLSFTPGAGATSHEVQVESPAGAGNWVTATGAFGAGVFNGTGLSSYTSYQYRIRGVSTGGNSAWVPSGSFFTDNTGSGSVEIPSAPVAAPSFTTQPSPQTVPDLGTATFTCAAAGSPTPNLQWQISTNGGTSWANLSGATSATYLRTALLAESGTLFRVIASNGVAPDATSNAVALTVTNVVIPPTVTVHPASQSVAAGSTVTLTSAATGAPTPTPQWRRNGVAIIGATSASYTFTAGIGDNGAVYSCAWTGSTTVLSAGATLTVTSAALAPTITSQPASITVNQGSTASFAVAAAGSSPLSYVWQRSDDSGVSWQTIVGATSATYTTPAATSLDQGARFRVVVDNGVSPSAVSASATLTVTGARQSLINPVLFEDMLGLVLPYVPSCPPPTAVFHLRRAAQDFFQRTLAWREDLPQLVTVQDQTDYTLLPPFETLVAKVLRYTFDGNEFDVIDSEAGLALALQEAATQASWTADRSTVAINPPPREAGKLFTFRVALKPAELGAALPGLMYDQYIQHIVDGALARLLCIPSKDWTDTNTAAIHKGDYEMAVARVSRMTSKGFARQTSRRINF